MSEQDKDMPGHRPVDEIKKDFRNHFNSVEFGSPDYLAFCDFYALKLQKNMRKIDIKNVLNVLGRNNLKSRITAESKLRVTEVRIAMLSNIIEDRKVRDMEYEKAYRKVEDVMSELWEAIRDDLSPEYPDQKNRELLYDAIEEKHSDILIMDFRNELYERFNQ